MSTTQTTTLQDSLTKIAEKSGKPIAEVQEAYNKALTTIPASVKSEQRRQKMALMVVNRDLTVNTRSTAVLYEVIVVATERRKDLMKAKREYALKQYEENMENALSTGLVKVEDGKVIPLDNRPEKGGKPNKDVGKPLKEHMWLRTLHCVARKPGETNWVRGTISLWNQQSELVIPIMKQCNAKLNGELKDGAYDLRSSVDTLFEIQQEMTDEHIIEIIDNMFTAEYKSLAQAWDYHKSLQNPAGGMTSEYWNSLIVTEGSVSWIQEFENSIKITLTDESLNAVPLHERGVQCWLPKELKHLINFGRGTIVTVFARTGDTNYYDTEKKQQTEDKILQLNLFSIIGRPGFIQPINTQGDQV